MVAIPGVAIRELGMEAVRIWSVPKVVETVVPFHLTTDALVNPVPSTKK
jgi:hypothetical protein